MKKRSLFVAVAIIMVALVFFTCDLIKPVDNADDDQDTVGDLVINGVDADNTLVRITFSRPAKDSDKATVPMINPQSGDKYAINYGTQLKLISSGEITVTGITILFTPSDGGKTFTGTYSGGNLTFIDNPLPTDPEIKGFHIDSGNNGGSSEANAIFKAWGEKNLTVVGNTVYINGDITVVDSIIISDKIKLVFNARDNNPFIIGTGSASTKVTVKGGIEVAKDRGVKLQGSSGTLVVEGANGSASTINGRLIVDEYATLDIAGDATITSGGVLELFGYRSAYLVANDKYERKPPDDNILRNGRGDAVFKLRGKLSVQSGGKFQMPDPYKFDSIKYITGSIEVNSGGELILVTASPKGYYDLHPLIGTEFTKAQGAPVGADFVLEDGGMIVIRISGDKDPNPAMELSGNAMVLGRLILDENHRLYKNEENERSIPYRFEVWLTYPLTVKTGGILTIGNSEAFNFRTTLLVTGSDFSSILGSNANSPSSSFSSTYGTAGISGLKNGINKGVLINDGGTIQIFNKNAIVQWFGGYFNSKSVFDMKSNRINAFYPPNTGTSGNPDNITSNTALTFKPYEKLTDYYLWSPEWTNGPPPNNSGWFPFNGTNGTNN